MTVRIDMWVLGALLAPMVVPALGCGEDVDRPEKEIVIGALIGRTGNNSEPSWRDAILLAQADVNAALRQSASLGAVGFKVVFSDSANEPSLALPRATALVGEKGAKALIVDTSQVDVRLGQTFYDIDTANDLGVPIQCSDCRSSFVNNATVAASDPLLQATYRNGLGWNFRNAMGCKQTATTLVRHLLDLGSIGNGDVNFDRHFKIGIYATNEVYGQACAAEVKAAAERLMRGRAVPIPVLTELVFHPRDAEPTGYSWRSDLDRLTDAAPDGIPDAIVVATFAEYHAAFVGNYKGSYAIPVFHFGSFRIRSVVQTLGTLAEGEEGFSTVSVEDDDSGATFTDEFTAATGLEPSYLDATYYDNALTLMLASLIAGRGLDDPRSFDGAALRDALKKTSVPGGERVGVGRGQLARTIELIEAGSPIDYAGASGPIDYDATNTALNRIAHFRVQDGKVIELERYDCIRDPLVCPLVQ